MDADKNMQIGTALREHRFNIADEIRICMVLFFNLRSSAFICRKSRSEGTLNG